MLSLLDLQQIYDYSSIYIVFTEYLNNHIEVKVSELLMCCILDTNRSRTCNGENVYICIGLFVSIRSKVTFYSLSIMSSIISLIINMKNIIQIMQMMVVYTNKQYYWIASFNNSISEMPIFVFAARCGFRKGQCFILDIKPDMPHFETFCLYINSDNGYI